MLEKILQQQPADGRMLFVDMNSFFASVEQQVNPQLRGQPVGVCPFLSDATVVIAASIEAKRYGIKTGTKVPEAKRLYPGIKLIQARPRIYRDYHRRIMAELDNTLCHVTVRSVDEALLRVPSYLQDSAPQLGAEVKQRLRRIGSELRCSVGIGSNFFLAKMGSNAQKPDGLVEIKVRELTQFYRGLQLTDLHGISWRMARRLRELGITSPLDFYRAPLPLLKQAFGANGEAWYLRLRGYEVDLKPTNRRMIGHQMTIVPQPATTKAEVLGVASQLTYRAAIRLRKSGLAARGIVVAIRFSDRTWWQSVYHGRQAFFDSATFFDQVSRLLAKCRMPKPVRFVSVSAIDLIDRQAMTQSLFNPHLKQESLSEALDQINFRYGENTVVTARQLLAAPPRDAIGFGNAAQNVQELPY